MIIRIVLAASALMLAACQQAPAPALAEDADPFVVMIGAERWEVIVDRALDGAREAPTSDEAIGNERYRADVALKSAAAKLVHLRNEVCGKRLLSGADCDLGAWPSWTLEPPTDATPVEELARRSDWVGETIGRFTAAGCEAGRQASGNEQFCSVE